MSESIPARANIRTALTSLKHTMQWRPTASFPVLRKRAHLLSNLRAFFLARDVLEVETPLLCSAGITDPSIEPYTVVTPTAMRFLQTSPEYAMKRLLAAFGEPVFQVSKAFRQGEQGSRHNPEFTLLEWYRPGFDYHRLMDEVTQLLTSCLPQRPVRKITYRSLFLEQLDTDPFTASANELKALAHKHLDPGDLSGDKDCWMDLLMSHVLEPNLGRETFCFVYDYPASQAALARIETEDGVAVGRRFELYVDGLELANGYWELADAAEQRRRFEADNVRCSEQGLPDRPVDEHLLAALEHGMPASSGVALGIDRLMMLIVGTREIRDVLAFDWERA